MPQARLRPFVLLLVCAAPVAMPARAAAPPPPPGRASVEMQAGERRFTKPAAVPHADDKAGPAMSLVDFVADLNRRRRRITESQIGKMRKLLAITAEDDPQKPDFYFRLGELYAENERFCFGEARALDQKLFAAPAAGKPALQERQHSYEREEQAWLLEAVKAYVAATRFARYERMDEVLFRLAAQLTSAKKEDQARDFFHRLIKDYPTSRYIPDAYLAFAESYFDKGEMERALVFYGKVAEFPASSVYPYAVYKKGWCFINLNEHKQALETFVGVVRLTREPRGKAPAPQLELLAKEVKKDIVKAYARVGGPDKAWEFFRRTGGDYAPKMMESLAELYWEEGKFADSSRVLKKIIADNMSSPRVCGWQGKVLRNSLAVTGDLSDQTRELERFGLVQAKLARESEGNDNKGAKPPAEVAECRDAFHDAARELAIVWHREAQKTQNLETFGLALRAYRLFIEAFPTDKLAVEMTYFAGEAAWASKRWRDAAELYTRVVEMSPQGKYVRDAAYAAVLAWKNITAFDEDEQPARVAAERARVRDGEQRGRLAPQAIPANLQQMIAAFHSYRKHVPDAPELPVIVYREAYIYYDYNQFDRAAPLFLDVVQRFPTHQLAPFAANLFLDSLNAQGKKKEVMVWVPKFLDTPALAKDTSLVAGLVSLMSDAYDSEGHEHEKHGDLKECGRSFLAAAEALPDHRRHAERLWNAGQCFQNGHLLGQAIKAWEALIKAHPDDKLAGKALYRVGAGYHQLGFYTAAAGRYEEFARKFPGEPQAATALGNATVFREGLGQPAEAIADMDAFVGFYAARRPHEAAGVFFQKAEVFDAQGKRDELHAHLRSYLDRWGAKGGVDRQVLAHFRLGELAWRASCPRPAEDGACVQVTRTAPSRGRMVVDVVRRKLGKDHRRTQCGPPTKSKIAVVARGGAQVAAADEELRAAIKLWKAGEAGNPIDGRDVDTRRASAAYAAAGAAFLLAERDYEELLRVKFPQGLDFSTPSPAQSPGRQAATTRKLEDSKRRYVAYLDDKAKRLERAKAAYLEVFKLRQAQWTIAAAARIGQLHQDFAGQLYTAEIPKDLPEVDPWGNRPRDLYCDALEDQAAKVEAKATEGFRACLDAATGASWYNEWSRLCERELNQLAPLQYPLASEIHPEAGFIPIEMSRARVMTTVGEDSGEPGMVPDRR